MITFYKTQNYLYKGLYSMQSRGSIILGPKEW